MVKTKSPPTIHEKVHRGDFFWYKTPRWTVVQPKKRAKKPKTCASVGKHWAFCEDPLYTSTLHDNMNAIYEADNGGYNVILFTVDGRNPATQLLW